MTAKRQTVERRRPSRWYWRDEVAKAAIRRFTRQVAEQFQPEKVILFGVTRLRVANFRQ